MSTEIVSFQKRIWEYYSLFGRSFAWRNTNNPYHIFVSEVMLQQTQTYRVEPKYQLFITQFPTFQALAGSSTQQLLCAWQGLGYNRRALFLRTAAQKVIQEYNGILPQNPEQLIQLPGIGKATCASIATFAFNKPTVFIETNIRAVFIYEFFRGHHKIHDKEIESLVRKTLDIQNPRHWYYALMDYGVMVKKMAKNPARASAHHTKQSKFEGSDRQIRGQIVKILSAQGKISETDLIDIIQKELHHDPVRIGHIINDLIREHFCVRSGQWLSL